MDLFVRESCQTQKFVTRKPPLSKRPKRIVISSGKEQEAPSKNGSLMSTKAYKQIMGKNEVMSPVSGRETNVANPTNKKGLKLVTKMNKKSLNVPGVKYQTNLKQKG